MSATKEEIEAVAKALIDADSAVRGYHPLHIAMKVPAAKAAIAALDEVRADLMEAAEQRGYANAMEAERKLHEDRIEQLEAERDAAYKRGLEEAAKVAETEGGVPEDSGSAPSDFVASGYNEACIDIASAIRAKIQENDDGH